MLAAFCKKKKNMKDALFFSNLYTNLFVKTIPIKVQCHRARCQQQPIRKKEILCHYCRLSETMQELYYSGYNIYRRFCWRNMRDIKMLPGLWVRMNVNILLGWELKYTSKREGLWWNLPSSVLISNGMCFLLIPNNSSFIYFLMKKNSDF